MCPTVTLVRASVEQRRTAAPVDVVGHLRGGVVDDAVGGAEDVAADGERTGRRAVVGERRPAPRRRRRARRGRRPPAVHPIEPRLSRSRPPTYAATSLACASSASRRTSVGTSAAAPSRLTTSGCVLRPSRLSSRARTSYSTSTTAATPSPWLRRSTATRGRADVRLRRGAAQEHGHDGGNEGGKERLQAHSCNSEMGGGRAFHPSIPAVRASWPRSAASAARFCRGVSEG